MITLNNNNNNNTLIIGDHGYQVDPTGKLCLDVCNSFETGKSFIMIFYFDR